VHFSGSKLTCNFKPLVDQSSPDFFIKRRRNFPSSYVFPILDMLPGSGDIHDQSLKWSKIDQNFACFWPQIFLGERPPNFWSQFIKLRQFPIMWQSFRAIGRGISEKAWWKKTSAVKHKPVRNGCSGRPNKTAKPYSSTWTTTVPIFVQLVIFSEIASGICWTFTHEIFFLSTTEQCKSTALLWKKIS